MRRDAAARMAERALELLASFDDAQRAAATWPFPSDDERQRWFYTPTDHGGLPLAGMSPAQHRLTHRLVASGLSGPGYVTTAAIIGLENILDHVEGWTVSFGRERGRDPLLYWIAVFGDPATGTWGWRFGGHHVSLHFTILDGEVVATTPLFFGADPAAAPLLGPHPHRPLGGAEDLGRQLVRSLDEAQRRSAIVSPVAPVDLVGANRTSLAEGDEPLPLARVWRGLFEGELGVLVDRVQMAAEAKAGLTAEHMRAVSFSARPKGLPADRMRTDQRELLRALLDVYLGRLCDDLAEIEKARFAGDRIGQLSFAWAGGIDVGDPHYYRVQGADLLVEYDNTQRDANHVHTVWRDLRSDFGRDALAEHYVRHEH